MKKKILKRPELMSPAGDMISLRAAIDAGCDAIYFGVRGMNMRSNAKNFEISDIEMLVQICRERKIKAYLALNTIIYENELGDVRELISKAKDFGVDAIICWDYAVFEMCREVNIPIFVSTQMSISNSEGLLFFYNTFGIKRFVLARECSLEDLKHIQENLFRKLGDKACEIEIEVFVHGAMCVSVSGRCFMSQFQFGKSANRGECLQPCRREYLISDKDDESEFVLGEDYVMSPKDLCALPFLERLLELKISSFKIEGRNRSPEYTGTVTKVYRQAIDYYFENCERADFKVGFDSLKTKLMEDLEKVYTRGFSSGFFFGKPVNEWSRVHGSVATARKEYVGLVTNYYSNIGVAEVRLQSGEIKVGDEMMFQGETTGVISQSVESMEVEHEKIEKAEKGSLVAFKTVSMVRRNDKVYVVRGN